MRNILLLIADDLGRDLGVLGNRAIRTPNLDRFAGEAVSFERAFCTTASCSASRSAIYTGMHNHATGHYGHSHGCHHFSTLDSVATAPRLFNDAGWRTGIVGKVHVAPRAVYPWQVWGEGLCNHRDGKAIAEHARRFIEDDPSRPFFLTIGYADPHRGGPGQFANDGDWPGIERHVYAPEDVEVPPFLPDLPEVRADLAQYYQAVDRLDQSVGMLLRALEQTGQADDTLVLFLSDNGIPFINSKTTLYDAGIHLPFLLRVPGRGTGLRNPNLVSFVDVLPTLLDWAGIPVDGLTLHGRSLLPILDATDDRPGWDTVYGSHTFHEVTNYYPTRTLRTQRWKYHKNVAWRLDFPFASDLWASPTWQAVRRRADTRIGQRSIEAYVRRPLEELYDLDADPHEIVNLAADPAHSAVLLDLRARLEAWQVETNDPWIFRDGISALSRLKKGVPMPMNHDLMWAGRTCSTSPGGANGQG